MLYKQSKFTVPAVGDPPAGTCMHGWVAKGKCIFCGEQIVVIKSEDAAESSHLRGSENEPSTPPRRSEA